MPVEKYISASGEEIPLDLNDPRDKAMYDEAVKAGKTPKKKAEPKQEPKFLSSEDIRDRILGVVGGAGLGFATGGTPNAVIQGVSGGIFPPRDATDWALMAAGGPIAGKASQLTKQATKNAKPFVRNLAQMLQGSVYAGMETTAAKAMRDPEGVMKDPSKLKPTGTDLLSMAAQGLTGALFANAPYSPSAQSANKVQDFNPNYPKKDPSKIEEALRGGAPLFEPARQQQEKAQQAVKDIDEKIAEYTQEGFRLDKKKVTTERKLTRQENLDRRDRQNKLVELNVEDKQANLTRENLLQQRDELEKELENIHAEVKASGAVSPYGSYMERAKIADQNKFEIEKQLKQMQLDAAARSIDKEALKKVDYSRASETLKDNIARIEAERINLQSVMDKAEREKNLGIFKNAELSALFTKNRSAEEMIDDLLGQNPKTIKDAMDYFHQNKQGGTFREAVLQHILERSYDPGTNSFANGMAYLKQAGKGHPVERLTHIMGDVKLAEKVVKDFDDIAKAADKITKNPVSRSALFTTAQGLGFVLADPASKKAQNILSANASTLVWFKWGTLMNKMASSPKFNAAFKDWMEKGASAEILKSSDYLMSQLREMGYQQNFTASGNPY